MTNKKEKAGKWQIRIYRENAVLENENGIMVFCNANGSVQIKRKSGDKDLFNLELS